MYEQMLTSSDMLWVMLEFELPYVMERYVVWSLQSDGSLLLGEDGRA